MPIIKSAKKRMKVAQKATVRNAKTKRTMREAIKQFRASLTTRKDSAAALTEAQKTIDIAVKKNVINKSRAARKKSQLASEAKTAGVKLEKKKATKAPKTTTKNTTTKKKTTAAKKPAKKAATTKKAAAKK